MCCCKALFVQVRDYAVFLRQYTIMNLSTPSLAYPFPIAPVWPDFLHCGPEYGRTVNVEYSIIVADELPRGARPKIYTVNGPTSLYNLPMEKSERFPIGQSSRLG